MAASGRTFEPPVFKDNKAPGAMRTIGEVCDALNVKAHVLRYWEQQFPMLNPLKRSGGRRLYRPEDVALVEHINRLVNDEGYTLKGARALLEGKGDENMTASTAELLASLRTVSGRLAKALAD